MRTFLTAAVLLATAAGPVTARPEINAPDVRRHVTGAAQTHFLASNGGVYRVHVSTSVVHAASTTPYSWVEVLVARCARGSCATPIRYGAQLPATAYTATDLKNVTLRLSAFGKPLTVTWTGPGPARDVDTTPAAAGTAVDLSDAWAATARVTLLGLTCTDAKAAAARHTTTYATGFKPPPDLMAFPPKAPVGQPALARSCRTGPA